jgi:methylmalonyl-CoA mutase cobalamin-binding domain/chain
MEVIYTGLHQTPQQIVSAALQEDAQAVGLSIHSGAHLTLFPKVVDLLHEAGADDVVVFGGGIIPKEDVEALLDDPSLGERLPEVGEVKEVAIKAGTFTRAAQDKPTLPAYLRVNVGDAIRWKNNDYMYHFIGDISLAPGGEAMQKFEEPGEFYFGCTAVPSEVIRIKVMENPQSESTDQANPRSDM